MSLTSPSSVPQHAAARFLPAGWHEVQEILESGRHEGHRLLLHLLDQLSAKSLSAFELGIVKKSTEEQIDFVCKLEGVALFALLADRYGIAFGLDKQTTAFIQNADIFQLAEDLGINIQRADLPWAMDVVGIDRTMHENFDLPPEVLPLDILFTVAARCRDWYDETIGHALTYHGRMRSVMPSEVREFIEVTLKTAYGTYAEEVEAGSEKELAYETVRRTLGISIS